MHFRSFHIYREGDQVADALENHDSFSAGIVWDFPPDFILPYYQRDYVGLPHYRTFVGRVIFYIGCSRFHLI